DFTLGELGRWFARKRGLGVDLTVLPVSGWKRDMTWRETGLPWIPPSPNLPAVDSAVCYACTGSIQHTSVSEGRGCCKPFEYVGAPFVDAERLVARLNGARLPGVCFREAYFTPAFNKYQGQLCAGFHLMILEERSVDPLRTMFAVFQALADLHPADFTLKPGFARWLDGTEWTAERLLGLDVEAYLAAAAEGCRAFAADMAPDRLYARGS
ncbi:MAG: DUF1343 domain-containing protein, partial [Lentisphaeria bacterium]|nr:DUF1343 domain-containing protein [Lentisphaeria bacterium]